MLTPGATGPAHAIRGYILRLRGARDVTHEELAEAIGLSRRAYFDWANGTTPDLKASSMCAAFRYLGGSFDHLRDLARPTATHADGAEMAELRLREEAADRLNGLMQTFTPEEYAEYMQALEEEAISQAQVYGRVRAILRRRAR